MEAFDANTAQGQSLFMSDRTDAAPTDINNKPLGDMYDSASQQRGLFDSISTRFLFGEKWPEKVAKMNAGRTKLADEIRENYPKLAAYTSLIASHFQLPEAARDILTSYKVPRTRESHGDSFVS